MDNCKGCYMQRDTGCMALKKLVRFNCWAKCRTEEELIKRYSDMKAVDDRDRQTFDDELAYLLGRSSNESD